MGLAAQNQVRNLFIGKEFPNHATVSALKAGSSGDLAVLSADGSAPALGEKFMVLQKNQKGTIVSSDIINPANVLYAKSIAYKAQTLGQTTISDITVDANTLYTVEVAICGYGSYSPEDEYIKKAFYKAATGDDQEAIVDGLIASLNRNFSREVGSTASYNPNFSFTKTGSGATSALVITEKTDWADNSFDPDTMNRINLDFRVNASFSTLPTITVVNGNAGTGNGKSVAIDEFYLKGERNDYMRNAGYPHNLKNFYDADSSLNYNTVEIGFYEEGRDEAKKSKKSITINIDTSSLADNTTTNALITKLNVALGAGSIDALATS